jgi:hypothetical protein
MSFNRVNSSCSNDQIKNDIAANLMGFTVADEVPSDGDDDTTCFVKRLRCPATEAQNCDNLR